VAGYARGKAAWTLRYLAVPIASRRQTPPTERHLLLAMPLSLRIGLFFATAIALPAQCAVNWQPGSAVAGTSAPVLSSAVWDRDGAGPLPALLVLGGAFTAAGNVAASRIATFDPATGSYGALGGGVDGRVLAMAVLPNGDLVIGGEFTTAGGAAAMHVARWNGSAWSQLGAGFNAPVQALTILPTGGLVAAGPFVQSGTSSIQWCAQWNGVSWLAMPGLAGAPLALATLANGTLVTGSSQWTGFGWIPLGSGFTGNAAALQRMPNGDLFAGGNLAVQGVATNVARWNGAAWSAVPAPGGLPVHVFGRLPNGNLAAASRQFPNVGVGDLTVFDGSNWTTAADPNAWIVTMTTLPSGELFVGGAFTWVPGFTTANTARWDGQTWQPLSTGTNGRVRAIANAQNGDLLVAGDFNTIAGVAAAGVARRSGGGWQAPGQGPGGQVRAVVELDNGDVVIGGTFYQPASPAAAHIARWNGSNWVAMGSGLDNEVRALLRLQNGDLVAGGLFDTAGGQPMPGVARWDGVSWQPFGNPALSYLGVVTSLAQLPNGDLVAGRQGPGPALWDGATWSELGQLWWSGMDIFAVEALRVLRDGRLVAVGHPPTMQTPYSRIGIWDGGTWSSVGQVLGSVSSALELPDGDVLFGGTFTTIDNLPRPRLARWNGTTFQTFVGGTDAAVVAMTMTTSGALAIGGDFQQVGATSSAYLAEATSSCAATATSLGNGCAGMGGLNQLVATSLPWLGGRYRSRATGMPSTGLVLRLLGVSPYAPQPLTLGGPGCQQFVAGDALELQLPVAGICTFELPIPGSAALLGAAFGEQAVPLEFSPAGALLGLTSSNALTMTVGNF
jgi:trimeric autotransporter adhesin